MSWVGTKWKEGKPRTLTGTQADCPHCTYLFDHREGADWGKRVEQVAHCKTCWGTQRDMIPWTELFQRGRDFWEYDGPEDEV